MQIEYKDSGDITKEYAEALVNTVNCIGVMGKGVALRFKEAFPANFRAYAKACKHGEMQIGQMFTFEMGTQTSLFEASPPANPRYIINFPTKRHWRGKSRMEYIDAGLHALADEICQRQIRSIAIPALGCGNGGLDWAEVRPRIEEALRDIQDLQVTLFEPAEEESAFSPRTRELLTSAIHRGDER